MQEQLDLLKEYRSTKNDSRKIQIKETLIHANFGFIRYSVAKMTKNVVIKSLEDNDYIMEAIAGMIEAIESFDVQKRVPLVGYAQFYMQRRISDLISNNMKLLKFPDRYSFESKMLQEEFEKGVSFEKACDKVGISEDKAKAIEESKKYVFLNINSQNEYGELIEHTIEDYTQNVNYKEDLYELLNKLISNLNDTEKKVVSRFYGFSGDGEYNAEIGRDLGLCRERIRQINKAACDKLKVGLGLCNISRDVALT